MPKIRKFLLLNVLFLVSCTSTTNFTALSTKELELKNVNLTTLPQQYVKVRECGWAYPYSGIPFPTPHTSLSSMVNKAFQERQGDLITDVKYSRITPWYSGVMNGITCLAGCLCLILPTITCSEIEGIVINTQGDK